MKHELNTHVTHQTAVVILLHSPRGFEHKWKRWPLFELRWPLRGSKCWLNSELTQARLKRWWWQIFAQKKCVCFDGPPGTSEFKII